MKRLWWYLLVACAAFLVTVGAAKREAGLNGNSASASISVSPGTLADTIAAGHSAVRALAIHNIGDVFLNWELRVFPVSGWNTPESGSVRENVYSELATTLPLDLTGIVVLHDENHGELPIGLRNKVKTELTSRGAMVIGLSVPITPTLLAALGVDILWLTQMTSGFTGAEFDAIRDWITAGGRVVFEESNGTTAGQFNALLSQVGSGVVLATVAASPGISTNIESHEMTVGVGRISQRSPEGRIGSASGNSAVLVRDVAGTPTIAYDLFGSIRILVSADAVFDDDSAVDRADNLRFANQVFDWLAFGLTAPTWIVAAPESGTIAPGNNAEVQVVFDASNLVRGTYSAVVRIQSNDPVRPTVDVPITLMVTGEPDISISEIEVDFGRVPVGVAVEDTLLISNEGAALLSVSGISSDLPEFVPDTTGFVLPPGTSQPVIITFTASEEAVYQGTLFVSSNDLDENLITMPLHGAGAVREVFVDPESVNASLPAGVQAYEMLTLYNQGDSDLGWRIQHGFDGLRILYDRSHGQPGVTDWTTIVGTLTAGGATVVENTAPITRHLLNGFDIYWSHDMTLVWSGSELNALAEWTLEGGSLLLVTDDFLTLKEFNKLTRDKLATGIVFDAADARSGVTTRIVHHETTTGVDSLYLPFPAARLMPVDPPGETLASDMSNTKVAAAARAGFGKLVAIVDEIFANVSIGRANNLLFGEQVFRYIGSSVPGWLSAAPRAGVILPHDGIQVSLTFNTGSLSLQGYDTVLRVHSSDVVLPELDIPVHLEVTSPTGIDERALVTYSLQQNYPNPFNPVTTIRYDLRERSDVELAVFNVRGELVRVLVKEQQPEGRHSTQWDGRNSHGDPVASGVYFCKITAGTFTHSRKMVFVE